MRPRPASRWTAILVSVGLLAVACSSDDSDDSAEAASDRDSTTTTEAVFPGDSWATVDPEAAGFDPAVLDELAAEAEANQSNCMVVTRHGQLVAEWYWNDTDASSAQEVFSATKSYTSTLVGLAQEDGDLDIDDPAADYIPEWQDGDSAEVTVRNLISNDSGRHWDGATDYQGLPGAADRTAFAVDLAQDDPPGTTWAYNNSAIQTLDAVLESATGEQPRDFAQDRIFDPLGMADTEMTGDPAGNTNMFFGMQSTCQDMARFGYLFLRNGNWDGDQVVPEEWVAEATGQPSQDINAAYGYLWWLNTTGPQAGAAGVTTEQDAAEAEPAQLVPGAPEDMYWALGLGGQVIQVHPETDTVVVRLGTPQTEQTFGARFASQVVTEALVDP
jgi:CubicO group peptidase (beta-lactamase class C family)